MHPGLQIPHLFQSLAISHSCYENLVMIFCLPKGENALVGIKHEPAESEAVHSQ